MCAEAYQGREPLRHINSAFMTFEVLDRSWKPKTLPRIRPEPVVSLILPSVGLKTHFREQICKMSILTQGFTYSFSCSFTGWEEALSGSHRQKEDPPRSVSGFSELVGVDLLL